MPSPAMSAKPSSASSDKAGEPSSVHCPSGSGGASASATVTETSPPAKRAKIADFATALMRACSVELPPGEGEDRISGEEASAKADAQESEGMECGVFPGSPMFKKLGKMPTEKIINDCIHGPMTFPPAVISIIDTKQFARLRKLKQLGVCQFLYPNATHTRFEHSLGVGYIAGKFARHLLSKYPEYMDEKDVICVMIAGICHDLGHGPFSHLWEVFVNRARLEGGEEKYQHEVNSIKMFEHLLESNNLRPVLKALANIDETDITFIKEQIGGILDEDTGLPSSRSINDTKVWPYKGRGEDKSFLYEIVANKVSGIDVDKWDYFLRDDYYMKIGHVFNYERFILFSRVEKIASTGRKQLVIRDKELENLKHMVEDRARLHMHGYQHKVTLIVDEMLVDAWLVADKHLKVRGKGGKLLSLSESVNDVAAHERLYDANVNSRIEDSEDPALEPARELLDRIERRDLYGAIHTVDVAPNTGAESVRGMTANQIMEEVRSFVPSHNGDIHDIDDETLCKEDIITFTKRTTTGMTTNKIFVYRKGNFGNNNVELEEVPLDGVFENIRKEIVFIVVKRRCVRQQAMDAVKKWLMSKGLLKSESAVAMLEQKNGKVLKFADGLAVVKESGDAAI